ncbi:hypothetical protein P886_1743 [Alteromonadaceae bacterium 2753L.S.0a.02]|nr:hypothetical protein P886_1743 [Alteromonadaceae bacterium 2753L.S.0a.02]
MQHKDFSELYRHIHTQACNQFTSQSAYKQKCEIQNVPRQGVSLVLSGKLPDAVSDVIVSARNLIGVNHLFYNAETWHVTVNSLQRGSSDSAGTLLPIYQEILAKLSQDRQHPFSIFFKGIVTSTSALLLCGYPNFDITSLRAAVHQELDAHKAGSHNLDSDSQSLRKTCHASLVIYKAELEHPHRYLQFVESMGTKAFGIVQPMHLKLINYRISHESIDITSIN